MYISGALSNATVSLSGLPLWPLVILVGILAVIFVLLLFGGQRRASEIPILSRDSTLPASTVRGYILALIDAERFADALPIAKAHLRASPGDDHVRVLYAILCAGQDDLRTAADEYQRVLANLSHEVQQSPASARFLACLRAAYADTLDALARHDEARALRQQASTLDPSLARPGNASIDLLIDFTRNAELERRVFEGLLEWENGRARAEAFGITDASEAARFYYTAVKAHPSNARLRGDLAQALHASSDHRGAELEFREALRLNPADPWLHMFRGQMLWRLDQLKDSEQSLLEAARLSPQRAAVRATCGMFLFQRARYPEGEQHLLAALEARPDVWVLSRAYGAAALRNGHIETAANAFRHAESHGANDLTFRLAFAEVKEHLGDVAGASEQYQLAIQLDPTHGRARAQWGGFLLRQGRLREAEQELRESLLVSASGEAHTFMAQLMLVERRLEEVAHQLQVALQFDPMAPAAKACQAEWLLLEGRPGDAETLARQVLATHPATALAELARGGALLALNRQLEAESALREAVRIQPTLPDQLLVWARGVRAVGRTTAALDLVGQALFLRPDWPEAQAERTLLVQTLQSPQAGGSRLSLGPTPL